MDSLTHIVLGACIGDLFVGRRIGKRAMLLGAIMQSLPDIDFVASFFLDPVSDLLAHRGFTHSILFAVLVTPLLSWIALKIHHKSDISFKHWNLFFITEMLIHLFIDGFNAYGSGWFEPFSHARISFHSIFVADPLFSIPLAIAFIALLILPAKHFARRKWIYTTLLVSACYLGWSVINKKIIDNEVLAIAKKKNIRFKRHLSTPTPLNNLLWFVALEQDSGYYIGYRSVFDGRLDMEFTFRPRNESMIDSLEHEKNLAQLKRFSQGFYTVEKSGDTLMFNDLRFGQVVGWQDPTNRFAFHFFLSHPEDNELVVQRGRFAKWDEESVRTMVRKIKGN